VIHQFETSRQTLKPVRLRGLEDRALLGMKKEGKWGKREIREKKEKKKVVKGFHKSERRKKGTCGSSLDKKYFKKEGQKDALAKGPGW